MNNDTTQAVGAPLERQVRPCPFCGGTNGSDEQGETYRWRLWRCNDCGACGPEVRCQITGSGQGGVKEARKLAADAWNERPLEVDAARALEAWDCTVLPRGNDGMMQERMECLRAARQLSPQRPQDHEKERKVWWTCWEMHRILSAEPSLTKEEAAERALGEPGVLLVMEPESLVKKYRLLRPALDLWGAQGQSVLMMRT